MIIGTPGNPLGLRPMFDFYSEFSTRGITTGSTNDFAENIPPFFNIQNLIDRLTTLPHLVYGTIDTIYPSSVYHSLSGGLPVYINNFQAGISPFYGLPTKQISLDLIWRDMFFTDISGNIKPIEFNYLNNNTSWLFNISSGVLPLRITNVINSELNRFVDRYTEYQLKNTPIIYTIVASFHNGNYNDLYNYMFSQDKNTMYPSGYINSFLLLSTNEQSGNIKHINYKTSFDNYLFRQEREFFTESLQNSKNNVIHPHNLNFKKYLCENMYAELDLYIDKSKRYKIYNMNNRWAPFFRHINPAIEYFWIYSGLPPNSPIRNNYPSGIYYTTDSIVTGRSRTYNYYDNISLGGSLSGNFRKVLDNYNDFVALDGLSDTNDSKLLVTLVMDGFPYTAEFILKSDKELWPLSIKVKNEYNQDIYDNYVCGINGLALNYDGNRDNIIPTQHFGRDMFGRPININNSINNITNQVDSTSNYFVLNKYWKGTKTNILENNVDLPKLGWKKCEPYLDISGPNIKLTNPTNVLHIANYFNISLPDYKLPSFPLYIRSVPYEDPTGYERIIFQNELSNEVFIPFKRVCAKSLGRIKIDNGIIINISELNLPIDDTVSYYYNYNFAFQIVDSNNNIILYFWYNRLKNYIYLDAQVDYNPTHKSDYFEFVPSNAAFYAAAQWSIFDNYSSSYYNNILANNNSYIIDCLKYKLGLSGLPDIKLGYYLYSNFNFIDKIELGLEIQTITIFDGTVPGNFSREIKIIAGSLIERVSGNGNIPVPYFIHDNISVNIPGLIFRGVILRENYNSVSPWLSKSHYVLEVVW